MIHPTDEARWRELESNADLPDVQELIRQEIQRGTIGVRPKPGGGIRIVPVGMPPKELPASPVGSGGAVEVLPSIHEHTFPLPGLVMSLSVCTPRSPIRAHWAV